jgi:hypothetical protein
MKLSKNIRYLVRVRDYETVHVEVGAEADHRDLGYSDEGWAELTGQQRHNETDHLELVVISEVERLARDELHQISQWSEISPNLAEDFLSSAPMQRSNHARTTNEKTGPAPASRRVRPRGGGPTSPSAA